MFNSILPNVKFSLIISNIKNMYGKQVRGIERSTFVLDKKGVLRREWRGVKADGHARQILEFVQSRIINQGAS